MTLLGIEDIVAGLGKDEVKLLVLVVDLEEVLERIAQGSIELGCLGIELGTKAVLQLLQILHLTFLKMVNQVKKED